MSSRWRRPLRVAAWIGLAAIIAIAFHYGKKYEADMLTDPSTGGASDSAPYPNPRILRHVASKSGASANAGDAITTSIQE
jgi:hypothetical protein